MAKSLEELRQRLLTPHRGGDVFVEIVESEYSAGSSRLFRGLAADASSSPRVVIASGCYGDFDLICTLSRRAGTPGVSKLLRLVLALRALSDNGRRSVGIVADDAHCLTPAQMERLALAVGEAAHETGASVRLFFIIKPYTGWFRRQEVARDGSTYAGKTWELRDDWPALPKLFAARLQSGRLVISELKREGLDVLSKAEAREEVRGLSLAS